MPAIVERVLALPGVRAAARTTADWVDLQWAYLVAQLEQIAPLTRGRMLDVGCGACPYEKFFLPHVDSYTGIEHQATFDLTNAAGGRRDGRAPDHYYDGARLPFENESFDCVLSIQVLEHTPDPFALLTEMSRVLKKGGLLILNAPFSFRLHEEPHDYFRYTPHGLGEMCRRSGLQVSQTLPQGLLFSVLGHKLNSFLAFRVARMGGLMQQVGKLGHEGQAVAGPRTWTLPMVLPAMLGVSAAARVLDWAAPDHTEALSYLVLAEKASDV
jgi:SAM-dependent methyltransferase